MMENILVALIAGGLSLIGVILTNMSNSKKLEIQIERNQAVMNTKLEALTEEVKKHNNFASRLPVVEEQIKTINSRLDNLEHDRG